MTPEEKRRAESVLASKGFKPKKAKPKKAKKEKEVED